MVCGNAAFQRREAAEERRRAASQLLLPAQGNLRNTSNKTMLKLRPSGPVIPADAQDQLLETTNLHVGEQKHTAAIQKLPTEILTNVYDFLPEEDRCCLALSCKSLALVQADLDPPVELEARVESISKLKDQLSNGWLPNGRRFCITCGKIRSQYSFVRDLPALCSQYTTKTGDYLGTCYPIDGVSNEDIQDKRTQAVYYPTQEFCRSFQNVRQIITDVPGFKRVVTVEGTWVADAARCRECWFDTFEQNRVACNGYLRQLEWVGGLGPRDWDRLGASIWAWDILADVLARG